MTPATHDHGPTPRFGQRGGSGLAHRQNLLLVVADAAARLSRAAHWAELIESVLERCAGAARVDRAGLFRLDGEGDAMTIERVAAWRSPDAPVPEALLRAFRKLPIRGPTHDFRRWIELFRSGQAIVIRNSDPLPPSERVIAQAVETQSILRVPVFVRDRLWGCVGFDNTRSPRPWLEPEVLTLWALAKIVGAVIERDGERDGEATT